ncbi:MAG: hypothetical protein NZ602_13415 [Thermoguttaceae bacterium]|nr:hypothetical protein [Thermoguttaceae bacterium]
MRGQTFKGPVILVVPPVEEAPPQSRFWHQQAPSWLVSMIVHLVVLILLALWWQPIGTGPRAISLQGSLAPTEDGRNYYQDQSSDSLAPVTAASLATEPSLAEVLAFRSPPDPTPALPSATSSMVGIQALEGGGIGHAGQAGQGPSAGSSAGVPSGKGKTRVFNVEGEGTRFVYVFDRSASMEGFGGISPLEAAKAQLLASIESLQPMHQFQIIFYNDQQWIFNPAGDPGKLPLATPQNKDRAKKWVRSITPDGGTRHEEALLAAIRLRPDCIFFLTDADDPKLSDGQLERIARRAAGIPIHTIEFGMGPRSGPPSFLARLAQMTQGNYAYVDITRLGRSE